MLSKSSRYRKLPTNVTLDARGRTLESIRIRLLPEVSVRLLHTVEEVDRLDHLAFKFYREPTKWWQLCDANPEVMSPQGLLGKDPLAAATFHVSSSEHRPPWRDLLRYLGELVGIEQVYALDTGQPQPSTDVLDVSPSFSISASLSADLDEGLRTQQLSSDLRLALEGGGVEIGPDVRFSYLSVGHWRITDQLSNEVLTLRLHEGAINVVENVLRHTLVLSIAYNAMNLTAVEIADRIGSRPPFAVDDFNDVSRTGKVVVVPSSVTG